MRYKHSLSFKSRAGLVADHGILNTGDLLSRVAIELDDLSLGRSDYTFPALKFLIRWIQDLIDSRLLQHVRLWRSTFTTMDMPAPVPIDDLVAAVRTVNERLMRLSALTNPPSPAEVAEANTMRSLCQALAYWQSLFNP